MQYLYLNVNVTQFNFDDCYDFVINIAEQILQYNDEKMAI